MFRNLPTDLSLGKKIRNLRKAKDWTQDQLADACNISVSYVSKIEKDQVPSPSEDVIVNLARALGADSDELWRLGGRLDIEGLARRADVRYGAPLSAAGALNMIANKGLSARQADIVYKIANDELSEDDYNKLLDVLKARDNEED